MNGHASGNASDAVPPCAVGLVERIDDLHLLNDRSGRSGTVCTIERQRIVMFRTNMNEMNIQSIDLG